MERNLKNDEIFIKNKVGLTVLPRNGELEDLGRKESSDNDDNIYEVGMGKRKYGIENVLRNHGVDFDFDNIIFYNAYRGYVENSLYLKGNTIKKISSIDSDVIEKDKNEIVHYINYLVKKREISMVKHVEILEEKFTTIKNGQPLDEDEQKIVYEIKSGLETLLNNNGEMFSEISNRFAENFYKYIEGLKAG
ncbi:hypothetical protein [Clostridium estertheticum]|uniref:Uncharacterized protein n=1 Tax=Clostridium estertheticum TaxID=238834 RepID=A0AA47I5K6_9CLOT|nr:hypothetical protein [Clostridium estertheticum]MBU3155001.1 hypothetical protein [Clostridium estertheticum]WAG58820.1 hypothetical protein LL038_14275 [Clostridium estertheticum]